MRCREFYSAALVALTLLITWDSCAGQDMQPSGAALHRVRRDQLCVTNGAVIVGKDGWLSIATPSSRAVVPGATGQVAEIRFRYLGPTARSKSLASGELRRQIGS